MISPKASRAAAGAVLAAVAALTACASMGTASREDIVRQRAVERSEAFVKQDFAKAYTYLTPSYRQARDLDAWRRNMGGSVTWEKAEVATVACEEQRCKVALRVSVKPLIPGRNIGTISMQFEETWLLEDGNWWLHQAL